nr:MoxR family ATPase [Ardenticatena sp.]
MSTKPHPLQTTLAPFISRWREDEHARAALLARERERASQILTHLARLCMEPPAFDTHDLEALLVNLDAARLIYRQIIEANDIEVVVPLLLDLLEGDGPAHERVHRVASGLRYAGPTVLNELLGWWHVDKLAPPTRAVRHLLASLHAYAAIEQKHLFRYVHALADAYAQAIGERLAPDMPLGAEVVAFCTWLLPRLRTTPPPTDEPSHAPLHAIREFGAPYTITPTALPDAPLTPPAPATLSEGEAHIRTLLVLPPDTIRRAVAHLLAGRHLILTGAPGTGKSHLALLLAELFGYYPMLVTATAEWSTFDVVGGLLPTTDAEGRMRPEVRPGYVYEALRQNWLLDEYDALVYDADGRPLRRSVVIEGREWRGVWLVIDELNRADIDKAFGDLFTALETGRLRVPALGAERSQLVPIPRDFRILATMNTRDRHLLFTLSDALKRRFAFLHLTPPTFEQRDEEQRIVLRRTQADLASRGLPAHTVLLRTALQRLHAAVRLVRAYEPLGTAYLLAALRYVGAAVHIATLAPECLAREAFDAEIAPHLERLPSMAQHVITETLAGRAANVFVWLTQRAEEPLHAQEAAEVARRLAAFLAQEHPPAADDAHRWASALHALAHGRPSARAEAHALAAHMQQWSAHLPTLSTPPAPQKP